MRRHFMHLLVTLVLFGLTFLPARVVLAALPGLALADGEHSVGEAIRVGGLAVFPVYANSPRDVGEFTTLDVALQSNTAIVRESSSSGSVGSLAVENRGSVSILILGGTVVKGGRQDRQIGQDVIVAAGATVNVRVFCVEQSRWTPSRDGRETGGRFTTAGTLAPSTVRGAGQYGGNQSAVWSEVAQINAAFGKVTGTGTLLATLEDGEFQRRREPVVRTITSGLDISASAELIVGMGYAVDGNIRSVRWFANHRMFLQHRELLVATAVNDSFVTTARNLKTLESTLKGKPPTTMPSLALPATADTVVALVQSVDAAAPKAQDLTSNLNDVREAPTGWGTDVKLKSALAGSVPPVASVPGLPRLPTIAGLPSVAIPGLASPPSLSSLAPGASVSRDYLKK